MVCCLTSRGYLHGISPNLLGPCNVTSRCNFEGTITHIASPARPFAPLADMHAKAVVDRSSVWEEDGSPDSTSRVPNIGDIDMSTVNRVLYQVTLSFDVSCAHGAQHFSSHTNRAVRCIMLCAVHSLTFSSELRSHYSTAAVRSAPCSKPLNSQ